MFAEMGNRGWELACMLESPEIVTIGLGTITYKVYFFFQRLIFQPPPGGYPSQAYPQTYPPGHFPPSQGYPAQYGYNQPPPPYAPQATAPPPPASGPARPPPPQNLVPPGVPHKK